MKNNNQFKNLIIGDIIFALMISYLVLGTYLIMVYLDLEMFPLKVLMSFAIFYILLCLLALSIPKVIPGSYSLSSNETKKWFIGFIFSRIWHYPFIQYPIFNSVILRTLFLKSLGCKIPFSCAMSSDISIYDPHLIEIGESSIIGMKSTFIPHYIAKNQLVLGEIKIGKNTLIGAASEIGANVTIEDLVRLDIKVTCFPGTIIPSKAHIKPYCILDSSIPIESEQVIPPFTQSKLSR